MVRAAVRERTGLPVIDGERVAGVDRKLDRVLVSEEGTSRFTAYKIGMSAKAALEDFVGGKTEAGATREISKLLRCMIEARRLELEEIKSNVPPDRF